MALFFAFLISVEIFGVILLLYVLTKLDIVIDSLQHNEREGDLIMLDLTALTAQVAANTSAEASAVTLIQAIAAQLAAASGNQPAVDALAAQLKASADALAAAVVANTPAAPAA